MSDKVERVARAIDEAAKIQRVSFAAFGGAPGLNPPLAMGAIARAAIAAMDEPKEAALIDQWGIRLDSISSHAEAFEMAPGKWFYSPSITAGNRTAAHPANDERYYEIYPRVWKLK